MIFNRVFRGAGFIIVKIAMSIAIVQYNIIDTLNIGLLIREEGNVRTTFTVFWPHLVQICPSSETFLGSNPHYQKAFQNLP